MNEGWTVFTHCPKGHPCQVPLVAFNKPLSCDTCNSFAAMAQRVGWWQRRKDARALRELERREGWGQLPGGGY